MLHIRSGPDRDGKEAADIKKTQRLDARRNIRKELVAFLSIVIIGMLAVVAYLSIAYSANTLKKDANSFCEYMIKGWIP